MSSGTLNELLFDILLVFIGCQLIIHEKQIAKFERKVARYIKLFFKGLYVTIKEKRNEKAHM